MALDSENQISVSETLGEALRLTWALRLPYIVLALAVALPNQALYLSGLMEPLESFTRQAKEGSADLSAFPLSNTLLVLIIGFVLVSAFGIFWYRYLLLGRQGALKFGFAEFNGMVGRFCGYGLMVMGVAMVAFTAATALACALCFLVKSLLGGNGGLLAYILYFPIFILAYAVPLSFAARTALIFPAIAVGRDVTLADAWAASKESGAALVWAILLAVVPASLVSYGIHSAIGAALGVNLLASTEATAGAYWWLLAALSPVGNLALAFMLAVVAIAYRDLVGREGAAESTRDSFAY